MIDLEKFIADCEDNAIPDSQIDLSDIPELTKSDFERGHFRSWKPLKKPMTMKIDVDVLDALRKTGKGWQTRVNDYLRKGVASGQL